MLLAATAADIRLTTHHGTFNRSLRLNVRSHDHRHSLRDVVGDELAEVGGAIDVDNPIASDRSLRFNCRTYIVALDFR